MRRILVSRVFRQCTLVVALVMSAVAGSAKEVICNSSGDEDYEAKVAARDVDSVVYRVRREKCLFDVNGVTATLSVAGEYERLIGTPQSPGLLATDSIRSVNETALATLIMEVAADDQDDAWQKTMKGVVSAGLNECLKALVSNDSTWGGAQDEQSAGSMRCLTLKEAGEAPLGRITVRLNNDNGTVHRHRIIEVSNHSTHWVGFVIPVVGQ